MEHLEIVYMRGLSDFFEELRQDARRVEEVSVDSKKKQHLAEQREPESAMDVEVLAKGALDRLPLTRAS